MGTEIGGARGRARDARWPAIFRPAHPTALRQFRDGRLRLARRRRRFAPARLRVIGKSAAGRAFDGEVGTGQAVRIFTGAPMPKAPTPW